MCPVIGGAWAWDNPTKLSNLHCKQEKNKEVEEEDDGDYMQHKRIQKEALSCPLFFFPTGKTLERSRGHSWNIRSLFYDQFPLAELISVDPKLMSDSPLCGVNIIG